MNDHDRAALGINDDNAHMFPPEVQRAYAQRAKPDPPEPDFECPEGLDPARLRDMRNFLGRACDPVIAELEAEGFTYDQACSVAAHLLLDVAWIAAGTGAIHAGRAPRPLRFIAAASATTARLCPVAMQTAAAEGDNNDG